MARKSSGARKGRSVSALVRAEDAAEEEILETPALSSVSVAVEDDSNEESEDDEAEIERRLVAEARRIATQRCPIKIDALNALAQGAPEPRRMRLRGRFVGAVEQIEAEVRRRPVERGDEPRLARLHGDGGCVRRA